MGIENGELVATLVRITGAAAAPELKENRDGIIEGWCTHSKNRKRHVGCKKNSKFLFYLQHQLVKDI